jgi:phasin family protein
MELLQVFSKETTMTKTTNLPNVEQLAAAHAAAISNLEAVANTALEAIESLAALNMGFARQSLEKGTKQATAALKLKTPQEVATFSAESVQPGVESVVAYSRSVYDIANGAAAEINGMLKKQFDDLAKKIQAAAVDGAKSAPYGSDVALAAVKQAIDAGNAAYADLSKKVQEAAAIAQANVAKATDAAVKATKRK